jgi:hypothetical protein
MALPPNAKITALVCSGRRRPKLNHGKSKASPGQINSAAMMTPTSMPTMPQITVTMANCRTTVSL